ncbi:MAG: YMGG-like glycine zipper-containing protein [Gemmatimonadaceae bacterium]
MFASSSSFVRTLALVATLAALSACTERRTAERADSDLSHDLALANQAAAQPALQDTVVAPAPEPQRQQPPAPAPRREPRSPQRQPVPVLTPETSVAPVSQPTTTPVVQQPDSSAAAAAAAAAMPAPAQKLVGAGTGIALSSGMSVCTNTNKVGDKLVATVTSPVDGEGGASIPAGSRLVLEVAQVTPGGTASDSSIVFRPITIYVDGTSYPISGTIASTTALQQTEVPSTGPSDKEKVAGGAVVGAILGQIFGHNTKSTVIGAAAGAATGAVVAHAQKNYQTCLPEGASLMLTLGAPLVLN